MQLVALPSHTEFGNPATSISPPAHCLYLPPLKQQHTRTYCAPPKVNWTVYTPRLPVRCRQPAAIHMTFHQQETLCPAQQPDMPCLPTQKSDIQEQHTQSTSSSHASVCSTKATPECCQHDNIPHQYSHRELAQWQGCTKASALCPCLIGLHMVNQLYLRWEAP